MFRVVPLLAAALLLGTSAQAADRSVSGRSVSVAASTAAVRDARRTWFERAVGDIMEGRVRLKGNEAAR